MTKKKRITIRDKCPALIIFKNKRRKPIVLINVGGDDFLYIRVKSIIDEEDWRNDHSNL